MIDAGYDPARLPPGQYLTEKWPVLHAGSVPHVELETWNVRIWGEVESELTLSWEELNALPRTENTQDIHCVTRWSRFDMTFSGIHWRELERLVRPKGSALYVIAHAEHGYPLRLVIPGKYFWKSAKWLRGIELAAEDKPGFWERYGYHNDADPFEEQRYAF